MNTKPSVRLAKKQERKGSEPQAEIQFAVDPNRWPTTVQSWVIEFQQHRRGESLPAFYSLFKYRTALHIPGSIFCSRIPVCPDPAFQGVNQ